MRGKLFAVLSLVMLLGLSFTTPCFAQDVPITVPTLGIDWDATITALIATVGGLIIGCLGLWAGIKVVYVAKRFIGGAVMGR